MQVAVGRTFCRPANARPARWTRPPQKKRQIQENPQGHGGAPEGRAPKHAVTLRAHDWSRPCQLERPSISGSSLGCSGAVAGFFRVRGRSQYPSGPVGGCGSRGWGLPRWVVGFLVSRRQKAFTNNFADAIDIVVRGVNVTGLPLNECLKIIARESPEPVRGEFEKLVEGISVGVAP